MDDFKKANVDVATALDYNAPKVVHLKDRGKVGKMLRRLARRRGKAKLRAVTELDNICVCCGEPIPEGSLFCRNCLLED